MATQKEIDNEKVWIKWDSCILAPHDHPLRERLYEEYLEAKELFILTYEEELLGCF